MRASINIHLEHGEITAETRELEGHNVALLILSEANQYGEFSLFFPATSLPKLQEIARLINEAVPVSEKAEAA